MHTCVCSLMSAEVVEFPQSSRCSNPSCFLNPLGPVLIPLSLSPSS